MNDDEPVTGAEAGQAMQRVLRAERDAELEIRNCEEKAREMVNAAQLRAQRIQILTDQRISNMEMRHDHKLDRLIKDIEKEGAAELRLDAGRQYDQEKLQSVIEKLALSLCGSGSGEAQ